LPLLAATPVRAELNHVPPPRAEIDQGPPPFERAPERARRPVALMSEFLLSLPTCQSGAPAERCRALVPAVGAGFAALYRPYPYFSFGTGFSYARANATHAGGLLDGELLSLGAWGRVYFYEEGAFDPYLELELGYGSHTTTFSGKGGTRSEDSAFGPMSRVGGGVDFMMLENLELGGAVGFTHLLIERGEHCGANGCIRGSAPGGAMLGALAVGLRATVLLGAPL
jgi:hypothetical protein